MKSLFTPFRKRTVAPTERVVHANSERRAMADGTGLRGSLSLQPHMIADLFARPASAFAAPVVIERITVGLSLIHI